MRVIDGTDARAQEEREARKARRAARAERNARRERDSVTEAYEWLGAHGAEWDDA